MSFLCNFKQNQYHYETYRFTNETAVPYAAQLSCFSYFFKDIFFFSVLCPLFKIEVLTVSNTTAKLWACFYPSCNTGLLFADCSQHSNHAKVINSRDISLIKRSYRGLHIDLPTFQPFPTKSRCLFKEEGIAIQLNLQPPTQMQNATFGHLKTYRLTCHFRSMLKLCRRT